MHESAAKPADRLGLAWNIPDTSSNAAGHVLQPSKTQGPISIDTLNATALRALYSAMSEISLGASPDLTLRQVLFLLYVGAQGCPVGQAEVTSKLDLKKSAVSKIATRLGGTTAGMVKSEGGLGLIDVNLDVSDFRLRVLSLTSEGESLLKRASAKLAHTQCPMGDEVSLLYPGVFPSAPA